MREKKSLVIQRIEGYAFPCAPVFVYKPDKQHPSTEILYIVDTVAKKPEYMPKEVVRLRINEDKERVSIRGAHLDMGRGMGDETRLLKRKIINNGDTVIYVDEVGWHCPCGGGCKPIPIEIIVKKKHR